MCWSPSQICSLMKFSRPISLGILDTLIGMTGTSVLLGLMIREVCPSATTCLHAGKVMNLLPRDYKAPFFKTDDLVTHGNL